MSNKDARSFKVPKIRREESKDNLRSVDINSRDCIEIVNTVKRSYLSSSHETPWQLKTAALVQNRELEAQFRAKKAELKEDGRHARDLVEHYAFMVQRDITMVPNIVKDGVKCKFMHQNSLGNSKLGVYLWRNADLQLRVAEGWKIPSCTLLMFKIVLGKCKALAQQNSDDNIEPTPNFDCHVPQSKPKPSDNFLAQLGRSQVYLYEYTEDCEPSERPRQCLPYAVLTYDKVENVPQTLKVDSYSKRQKVASVGVSDLDTTKANIQGPINKRDPRLSQADSSLKANGETGLCVPRLTPGPPPKDPSTSANDLEDPRSQLNFLKSKSDQTLKDSIYQPSFGPSDSDEQTEMDLEESEQTDSLTSLPPLKLPLLPDPLIPPNSQLDTRYTDPRFGYVDSESTAALSDPRLRYRDPRLQPTSFDPRLQQMQFDPRKQQGLSDPRLQQDGSDPRLKPSDHRFQKSRSQTHDGNFPSQGRIIKPLKDDVSNTRKKLSLSDYKKKVNLSKPFSGTEQSQPLNSDEQNKQLSGVKLHETNQPSYNSHSHTANNPGFKDLRLQQPSTVTPSYSATISEQRDQRHLQNVPSQNMVTQLAYPSSISQQGDSRLFQQNSGNISQNDRSSLKREVESPLLEVADTNPNENDIVVESENMAKTLNELSDPDDISQSPKHLEQTSAKEQKNEDPMLSAAMQKLVEHSGNVTLFTEALRMLQDSAEQYGDQLADPEFLVKKIAEKIEELSKLEAQRQIESKAIDTKSKTIQEISSPDVMSPDINSDSKTDVEVSVKDIPLESATHTVEKTSQKAASKLDQAMQKTLEELERLEKADKPEPVKLQTRNPSHKSKTKRSKNESSCDSFLLDIPIPPEPTKKTDVINTEKAVTVSTVSFEKQVNKGEIERKMKSVPVNDNLEEDDDDDMKFSQVLPSLQEQHETKKKPLISFSFKRKSKPSNFTLAQSKGDLDLRVKKNTPILQTESDSTKKKQNNTDSDMDLIDEDFRKGTVQERNDYPSELNGNKDKKVNVNKSQIVNMFDSDSSDIDHRIISKQNTNKRLESIDVGQKKSSIDPFGFDHEDVDDRNKLSDSNIKQKKEVNDFGDIDWRHPSDTPVDVDFRSTDSSTENSQSSELGDFDLRRSHSRSVSPTLEILSSKKESSQSLQPSDRKLVDPFGLDEDSDERLVPRSNSPLQSKASVKKSDTLEIAAVDTQDSNSDSGALFDAYAVGKSSNSGMTHASNEFGDIDWRHTAASEMGDVDMRSVPTEKPTSSNIDKERATTSTSSVKVVDTPVKGSDPFQQMNKDIKNMFSTSHGVSQHQSPIPSFENFKTSNPVTIYESYSTTSKTFPSGNDSNNKTERTDANEYTTTSGQSTSQNHDGFRNIMQNLDFSNLKNILASVQKPVESVGKEALETPVVADEKLRDEKLRDEQKETNMPCFFKEFSPLKKEEQPACSKSASPNKSKAGEDSGPVSTEKSIIRIPGFDISPEKDIDHNSVEAGNSATKLEIYNSPSNETKKIDTQFKRQKSAETKTNESLPSTPKNEGRTSSEDNMTPLPNISYQAAILESIEQSALKVRNDDSFASEMEESPIRITKNDKSEQRWSVGTKRRAEEKYESSSRKMLKTEIDRNKPIFEEVHEDADDDDDEESGLVIDLSPSVKTVTEQFESPVIKSKNEVDLTDETEPVLVIDDSDEEIAGTNDLHAEDTMYAKRKDEITEILEKSRKNMVIKLKGETKLVNPKTGKAYNEVPKGSAIEVLGQTSKKIPNQQFHPVPRIEPVSGKKIDTTSVLEKSTQKNTKRGLPDLALKTVTIGKSSHRSQQIVNTANLAGQPVYMKDSPGQNFQEMTKVSSENFVSTISPVSTTARITSTVMSPLPLIPPAASLEYVHPHTGKTIKYGQARVHPVYGHPAQPHVPVVTVPVPEPLHVTRCVSQSITQPIPLAPGVSVRRPVLSIPGQNRSGSIQVLTGPKQVCTSPLQLVKPYDEVVSGVVKESKSSSDVFDCFRDKIEKRETNNEPADKQKYSVKQNESTDVVSETKNSHAVKLFLEDIEMKAKKELNAQRSVQTLNTTKTPEKESVQTSNTAKTPEKERIVNTLNKSKTLEKSLTKENDNRETVCKSSDRKRPGSEDCHQTPTKKIKQENETKPKPKVDFGTRILESLTEVKSKLRSPEKNSQSPEKPIAKPRLIERKPEDIVTKIEPRKEKIDSGASSELEDGEISEESESEEPVTGNGKNIKTGSCIPVLGSGPGQFNRIPTIGSWRQHSPNLNRNLSVGNNIPSTCRQNTPVTQTDIANKVGADWADIIQNPQIRTVERVKATNIESPSLRAKASSSSDDAASIVSKSAASITKNRQKYKAQSQVKTLGEWLKLELEIDNIEPLKNIIPYALDTDLTQIPKQRKRKIRIKVKNAIQQEGSKVNNADRKETVTVEVLLPEKDRPKPLNPNYLPEVSNEQTDRELKMLWTSLKLIKERVKQQATLSNLNDGSFQAAWQYGQFSALGMSAEDHKMIIAMTYVESEMKTHLSRTRFYGYPHRRVPDELLLDSELAGFKAEAQEVFLILMLPLSERPYQKLLQLKNSLEELCKWRNSGVNKAALVKVDEEIRQCHNQRQAVLRGFTGYLNKKRIQKLQETIDKYTMVYDYFKMKTPPTPDAMLKFIRTTQMDLRQHLILARQYLALEEQRMQ